jgi:hypothetical protein
MSAFVLSSRGQPLTPISPVSTSEMRPARVAIPALPITPPDSVQNTPKFDRSGKSTVQLALHVLAVESAGLSYLEKFYATDPAAQHSLSLAVDQIALTSRNGGKLVIAGVGKSGKIGQKIEATFKSLGVDSTFLNPTDALHGDLGTIKNVCCFVTAQWTVSQC